MYSLFFLIIKHAMTISFKILISYLISKFFAHAFVVFSHLKSARAVKLPTPSSAFV